jgi:hypothetical protein
MNSTNICVDKAHNTETTILGGNNTHNLIKIRSLFASDYVAH